MLKETLNKKIPKLIIIGVILILAAVICSIFFVSTGPQYKARDAKRQSDIRQISLAMNLYYEKYGEYLEIKTTDGNVDNESIGEYLDPIPQDFKVVKMFIFFGPDKQTSIPYKGFSNSYDKSKYCIYTYLDSGEFFVASPKGTKMLDEEPINLDCW